MLLPKSVEQRIRKMRMMSPLWATPARMRLSSVHMCYFMTLILLPSTINAAIFTTNDIGQSNPLAAGSNTITVTIQTDTDLSNTDSSVVTISGLTNAPDAASLGLTSVESSGADLFSDGSNQGKGALSSGTLTLTVHTGQTVVAGTQYAFSFTITNPSSAQNDATVTIAASGTAAFPTSRGVMTTDTANVYGVTNGGKPMKVIEQSFSTKAIGQSTPLAGADVTITVTLTANSNFPAGSIVTITGLTGTQTEDTTLTVTSTDGSTSGLLGTSGVWTKSDGKLVLTAAGAGTAYNAPCTVTFVLKQAAAEYTPPTVSVAASIKDGSSTVLGSIAQVAMDAPDAGTGIGAIVDTGTAIGANPLVVVLPEFDVRKIGQSNPLAGGSNTITVTIQSNVNLAQATDSSVVTISGLTNAPDAASLGLTSVESSGADLFSDGTTQGKGALSSGTLTLTVHTGQTVVAGTQYAFSFTITNPASEQTFATPTIAASGTASFATSRGAMSTDIADRYGVADGGKPMTVIVPSLSVKSIGQSTPLAGATVTISVTLTANVDFPNDSTVTIVGLTGTQTTDSGSLAVTSTDGTTSGLMESSGGWTQSTGTLELTAGITGTAQGAACTITFDLQQASAEYTPPTVSIVAAINNGSTALGSIGQAAMVAPNSPLLGVANGSNPLVVVVPEFDVRKIGQSNPLAGGSNTITVTIQSNVNLAQATDSSVVTISGLTSAPDALSLALTSVESSGADLFSDGTTQGKGALTSGTLTLTVYTGQTVAAGTQYAFSFTITNPSSAQGAASAVIEASGTASFVPTALDAPGSPLLGVPNGANPLLVVVPEFDVREIGQSNPLAGGSNTITVTIQSNVNLAQAQSSAVTLTALVNGLSDGDVALTDVASTGATTVFGGQGVMNNSGGTLTLTVASGETVAAGTTYKFSFTITNPSTQQNHATVTIAASGTAAFPTSRGDMSTDTADVYGVTNGGKPVKVIEQAFSTKFIRQSTPLAGADVTITVTLTANSNFPAGSIVTITGLTGTQTEDTTLTVTSTDGSTSGLLGTSGVWTKSDGNLVLTAPASKGTAYNTPCTVTFVLKQAAAEYTPPTVSVAATIKAGSTVLGSIVQVAMDDPDAGTGIGAIVDTGTAIGANPLVVVLPEFDVRKIGQSNPVAGGSNTITVTIQSSQLGAGDGQLRGDNIGAHECAGCGEPRPDKRGE